MVVAGGTSSRHCCKTNEGSAEYNAKNALPMMVLAAATPRLRCAMPVATGSIVTVASVVVNVVVASVVVKVLVAIEVVVVVVKPAMRVSSVLCLKDARDSTGGRPRRLGLDALTQRLEILDAADSNDGLPGDRRFGVQSIASLRVMLRRRGCRGQGGKQGKEEDDDGARRHGRMAVRVGSE